MCTESFTFRVSTDLRKAAEKHAQNRGISLSEDIRHALKEYYHLMPIFALVVCSQFLDTIMDLVVVD